METAVDLWLVDLLVGHGPSSAASHDPGFVRTHALTHLAIPLGENRSLHPGLLGRKPLVSRSSVDGRASMAVPFSLRPLSGPSGTIKTSRASIHSHSFLRAGEFGSFTRSSRVRGGVAPESKRVKTRVAVKPCTPTVRSQER